MSWTIPTVIPLPRDFKGFDPLSSMPSGDFSTYARHLPHWRLPRAAYFITFRLNDSIPSAILAETQRDAASWRQRLADHARPMSESERTQWQEFQRARLRKLERLLDQNHGECLLREARHRQVVADALHHFEGQRCEMLSYVVMPNHVHALCRLLGDCRVEDLCRSWKVFTAQHIQRSLGRKGSLWQDESFDRIIRDKAHYQASVRYIAKNPLKAKLQAHEASTWFCQSIQEANQRPT